MNILWNKKGLLNNSTIIFLLLFPFIKPDIINRFNWADMFFAFAKIIVFCVLLFTFLNKKILN